MSELSYLDWNNSIQTLTKAHDSGLFVIIIGPKGTGKTSLVRDFARNIVEYALYKKLIILDDPEIIRPPYKSEFPASFPSNDEIDTYEFDYDADDFKSYYSSQNTILSSMTTEYGRGTGSYGNFGRYTFQSALNDWGNFDPNDLSNYACQLIFTKYGYDVERLKADS